MMRTLISCHTLALLLFKTLFVRNFIMFREIQIASSKVCNKQNLILMRRETADIAIGIVKTHCGHFRSSFQLVGRLVDVEEHFFAGVDVRWLWNLGDGRFWMFG